MYDELKVPVRRVAALIALAATLCCSLLVFAAAPGAVSAVPPTAAIVRQPEVRDLGDGRFAVTARVTGSGPLRVLWRYERPGGGDNEWTTVVSDGHVTAPAEPDAYGDATMTIRPFEAEYAYDWVVEVEASGVGTTTSARSERFRLTRQPGFLLQPTVTQVDTAGTITVKAVAAGTPTPQVFWRVKPVGSDHWLNVASPAEATFPHAEQRNSGGEGTLRIDPRVDPRYDGALWQAYVADPDADPDPDAPQRVISSAPFKLPRVGEASFRITQEPEDTVRTEDGYVEVYAGASGWPVPQVMWEVARTSGSTTAWSRVCSLHCPNRWRTFVNTPVPIQVRALFKQGSAVVGQTRGAFVKKVEKPAPYVPITTEHRRVAAEDRPLVYSSVTGRDPGFVEYYPTFHYAVGPDHEPEVEGSLDAAPPGGLDADAPVHGPWRRIPMSGHVAGHAGYGKTNADATNNIPATNWASYEVTADDPVWEQVPDGRMLYVTITWWGCRPPRSEDPALPGDQTDPGRVQWYHGAVPESCLGGPVQGSDEITHRYTRAAPLHRTKAPVITADLPERTRVNWDTSTGRFGDDANEVNFQAAATADHEVDVQIFDDTGNPICASATDCKPLTVADPARGFGVTLQAGPSLDGKRFRLKVTDHMDGDLVAWTRYTRVDIVPWRFGRGGDWSTVVLVNQTGSQLQAAQPHAGADADVDLPYQRTDTVDSVIDPGTMTAWDWDDKAGGWGVYTGSEQWSIRYDIGGTRYAVLVSSPENHADPATHDLRCEVLEQAATPSGWMVAEDPPYVCEGYDPPPADLETVTSGWSSADIFAVRMTAQTLVQFDGAAEPERASRILQLCGDTVAAECYLAEGHLSDSVLDVGGRRVVPADNLKYNCESPGQSPWDYATFRQDLSQTISDSYQFYWNNTTTVGFKLKASLGGDDKFSVGVSGHFIYEKFDKIEDSDLQKRRVIMNLYPGEIALAHARVPAKTYVGTVHVKLGRLVYELTNARFTGPDLAAKAENEGTFPTVYTGVSIRQMTDEEHRQYCTA